jgi:Zn finger protein HypA/HybF involved in hydrogenase expression
MPDFNDLINIEEFNKREDFNPDRWKVSFYCKDCREIVETDRSKTKRYEFTCKKCKWKNIAIWTKEGLKEKFKIK